MEWQARQSRPQRVRSGRSEASFHQAGSDTISTNFGGNAVEGSTREVSEAPVKQHRSGQELSEANQPIEDGQRRESEIAASDGHVKHKEAIVASGDEQAKLRAAAEEGFSFEYLDHTADVQLHGWGNDLEEAFVNTGLAMLNYMTPLKDGPEVCTEHRQFTAEGHDMHSLVFSFLDELLFLFNSEFVVLRNLAIDKLDRASWTIEASGSGYIFDRQKHSCGTEVKAITYSAMQVNEKTSQGDTEIFVVVDI